MPATPPIQLVVLPRQEVGYMYCRKLNFISYNVALLTNWSVPCAVNLVTALDGLSVPMHSLIVDMKLGFIHSCETGFTVYLI
uniref:Uncharacterized protein n=1 Tax=Musa acuminata subsp. malaccensis TaxID=214687 RepID=A0A804IBP6_MUSAM